MSYFFNRKHIIQQSLNPSTHNPKVLRSEKSREHFSPIFPHFFHKMSELVAHFEKKMGESLKKYKISRKIPMIFQV